MTIVENVADSCIIFLVGCFVGSVFYFIKGALCTSSNGRRLTGGVRAVITNSPRVRRGAAFFVLLAAMEANLHALHVQGAFNKALAWGAASALFSVRRGTRDAVGSGLMAAAYGGAVGIAIFNLNAFVEDMLIN
ncbi:hypothetical protein ACQ4PT_045779 [Festuca glaucescens]